MRHVCCYSEVCLQMVHLRPAWGGHVLFDALIGRESVFGTLCFTISIYRSFLQYLKNILKVSYSRRVVKPLTPPICIFKTGFEPKVQKSTHHRPTMTIFGTSFWHYGLAT